MTLWAGRVGRALDPAVAAFLRADDAELLPYDCEATAVHARRLHAAGLLDDDELAEAESRLAEIATGGGIEPEDEDVHTAIERLLGDVGRKIHAGRSRNDQVAAAFRLYVVDAAGEARAAIGELAGALLDRAEADAETPMPGYTHLQRAQPITVGHHLLAWVEMLERDLVRFAAAAAAAASRARSGPARSPARRCRCPRPRTSSGTRSTRSPTATSRSTTSTRSPSASSTSPGSARSSCSGRPSEFGFARLGEDAATGSSMMPQKLNPDVAELARGKSGTAIGRLTGLLATVKGLPLAYNRDLQEDKAPVFAARADLAGALAALTRSCAASSSTGSGSRLRRAIRCCSPPTRPRSSFGRECRSATRTSRSPSRCGTAATSRRRRADRPAPGPGGVADAVAAARARLESV